MLYLLLFPVPLFLVARTFRILMCVLFTFFFFFWGFRCAFSFSLSCPVFLFSFFFLLSLGHPDYAFQFTRLLLPEASLPRLLMPCCWNYSIKEAMCLVVSSLFFFFLCSMAQKVLRLFFFFKFCLSYRFYISPLYLLPLFFTLFF